MSMDAPHGRSWPAVHCWAQRGSGRRHAVTSEAVHRFRLRDRVYDVTSRTLVMGILNRTPDSFFDRGATFDLDTPLTRAEQLVAEGADVLDVGGVKAGPGPEVSEAEELDRVVPTLDALRT